MTTFNLSGLVNLTRTTRSEERIGFESAARKVLAAKGFDPDKDTVGDPRITNDLSVERGLPILRVIVDKCVEDFQRVRFWAKPTRLRKPVQKSSLVPIRSEMPALPRRGQDEFTLE